mmetsp:Transcript_16479/g.38024  ORF Transcript_16479/g.38024 Transcript_16479/m.38024 type:complete len:149 (-) Transcript_16479:17-463(-)
MTRYLDVHPHWVNMTDPAGQYSCLIRAMQNDHWDLVRLLVSRGADYSTVVTPDRRWPPAHWAAHQGQWQLLQLFQETAVGNGNGGVDDLLWTTARNPRGGRTEKSKLPYHRACEGTERRHVETVHFFLTRTKAYLGLPTEDKKRLECC